MQTKPVSATESQPYVSQTCPANAVSSTILVNTAEAEVHVCTRAIISPTCTPTALPHTVINFSNAGHNIEHAPDHHQQCRRQYKMCAASAAAVQQVQGSCVAIGHWQLHTATLRGALRATERAVLRADGGWAPSPCHCQCGPSLQAPRCRRVSVRPSMTPAAAAADAGQHPAVSQASRQVAIKADRHQCSSGSKAHRFAETSASNQAPASNLARHNSCKAQTAQNRL